eukprot:TRINITY_DN8129_c0_g1_i1.p1 TRINITY_DN8129_c0_g1~~TRINITY_DN8129_c0_g1_i1.p1  ORF type:complete len:368 (+),score=89.72 TRINITY_DN8129_c0_g1_i1:31-1134(+)
MTEVAELLGFLSMQTRADVRGTALELVLGITASKESEGFFKQNRKFVDAIVQIVQEETHALVVKDAIAALINLAPDDELALQMLYGGILDNLSRRILSSDEEHPDPCCMLLVNLTRHAECAKQLTRLRISDKPVVYSLVEVFCTSEAHTKHGNLHHLANVFFNITQIREGRRVMMARSSEGCVIQRLLPFTQYQESILRRGGVIGALRNCCFDSADHEWLLSSEVDLLPNVLLPLAGPEEFDEDDMDGMPDDLQYLPPDKERETDADIRKMLLEALLQLCATKPIREKLRQAKVYPILREYHLWEPVEAVQDTCEQVVQILIQEEHDLAEDLHKLEVTDKVAEQLDDIKNTIASGEGPEVELVPSKE